MFSYRQILRNAFKISWKNKYLWFFGIFASFLSIGSEYQILWRSLSQQASLKWYAGWANFLDTGIFTGKSLVAIGQLFAANPGKMIALLIFLLIVLGVAIAVIWLAVASQVAIVSNSEKIIKNRKDKAEVGMHDGLRAGSNNFWSVFGLNLFSKIIINIVVILITLPLLFTAINKSAGHIIYIILFVLLIPVAIAISLLMKYAITYVILKKQKMFAALKNAWNLFLANWIISLEMALLLFVISFLATLAILLASLIIAVPFIILATSFFHLLSMSAFWVMVILAFIVITVFIILSGAWLSTFQVIVWTNLFMQLNSAKGGESKLERVLPEKVKNINLGSDTIQ
jgi:hypothetical protein